MRALSLTFTFLLLSGIALGSLPAAAETNSLPAITNPAPAVSRAATSPDCEAESMMGAILAATDEVSTAAARCGSCSDTKCRSKQIGQYCTGPTPGYSCQNVYGNICSSDGFHECRCWTGPLP